VPPTSPSGGGVDVLGGLQRVNVDGCPSSGPSTRTSDLVLVAVVIADAKVSRYSFCSSVEIEP
jgi:hypothetical protein